MNYTYVFVVLWKSQNIIFVPCIEAQFIYLLLRKSITMELFPHIDFSFSDLVKNNTNYIFLHVFYFLLCGFVKITKDCFFLQWHLNSIFLVLSKLIKMEFFLHILDFTFLWFCENQYKFYFFHVLMTSIFVILWK